MNTIFRKFVIILMIIPVTSVYAENPFQKQLESIFLNQNQNNFLDVSNQNFRNFVDIPVGSAPKFFLPSETNNSSSQNISNDGKNSQNLPSKTLLQKIAIKKSSENLKMGDGKIFEVTPDIRDNLGIIPFWIVFQPNGNIFVQKFSENIIANFGNNKNIKISGKFVTDVAGEYRVELWSKDGEVVFSKIVHIKSNPQKSEIWSPQNTTVTELFERMNTLRGDKNLENLSKNPLLQKIAIRKVVDMATKNYIAHTTPDGKDIFAFVDPMNANAFYRLGENVAGWRSVNSSELFLALLRSRSHYDAIFSQEWKQVGMAFAEKDGQQFFVQIFAD